MPLMRPSCLWGNSRLNWRLKTSPSSVSIEIHIFSDMLGIRACLCCVRASRAHYVAFAKTPKRIRNGVLSVYFKIQVLKNYRISISAQRHISAWAFCLSWALQSWSAACPYPTSPACFQNWPGASDCSEGHSLWHNECRLPSFQPPLWSHLLAWYFFPT